MFPIVTPAINISTIITLLNLTRRNNLRHLSIYHTRQIRALLYIFHQSGLLHMAPPAAKLQIILLGFNQTYTFKKIIHLSTPHHAYFISFANLALLARRTHNSVFILSTDRGIITHLTAMRYRIGGRLICYIP